MPNKAHHTKRDPLGRWIRTKIYPKMRSLVIYNTYRTSPKTLATADCDTPWMEQWQILRVEHGDEVDPRKQHMYDLCDLVQQDREAGDFYLIWGDFNENYVDEEKKRMSLLTSMHGLVQIILGAKKLHSVVKTQLQEYLSLFLLSGGSSLCV